MFRSIGLKVEELRKIIELIRSIFDELKLILDNDGYDLDKFDTVSQQLFNKLDLTKFDKFVLNTYVLKPIFDEKLTDKESVLFTAFKKSEPLKSLLNNYCKQFDCSLSSPNGAVKFDVSMQFCDCDLCKVISHYNF